MGTDYNNFMGMTAKQTAEYLGTSIKILLTLICRDTIKAKKHGHDWDLYPESVKAYKSTPKDKGRRQKKELQQL
jgi:hypothetical protein